LKKLLKKRGSHLSRNSNLTAREEDPRDNLISYEERKTITRKLFSPNSDKKSEFFDQDIDDEELVGNFFIKRSDDEKKIFRQNSNPFKERSASQSGPFTPKNATKAENFDYQITNKKKVDLKVTRGLRRN
jgi:hypothetical protein